MKFSKILLVALMLFSSGQVSAQDRLLDTPPGAPSYRINNVRREAGQFGKELLSFDYRRVRKGYDSLVSVSGRTSEGKVSISVSVPDSKDSGTLSLASFFSGNSVDDLELFLTQSYQTLDNKTHKYLVSNVLRVGNPGSKTRGEVWNAGDKEGLAEYQRIMKDDSAHKFLRRYKVSVQPEEGYELLPNNAIVTKATPLKACLSKKWYDVEALSQNDDGTVNILWKIFGRENAYSLVRSELTIESETLKSLRRDPNIELVLTKVDPSLPMVSLDLKKYEITIAVKDGWTLIPDGVDIPKGTPLKGCYSKKWKPLTCLRCNEDGTINVRWDEYRGGFECRMVRNELIVAISVVGEDAAKMAAAKATKNAGLASPLRRKNYKVSIEVPPSSQFIPKDVQLRPGTALQACYAGRWNPVTLIACANDGSLNVSWDAYSSGFDCSIERSQLIIQDKILKEATIDSQDASAAATDEPSAELRTWASATGKFKVEAKLLSQTESTVTLLMEDGKEKTLPIAKLSTADQKFLKESGTENPFN